MRKVFFTLTVLIAILILSTYIYEQLSKEDNPKYGVSFSAGFARHLGLDFKKTYIEILDGLQVRKLRIPTYWSDIEKKQGEFDFSEVDFMVSEAGKRGAKVLLVLGARQPRWPECHLPDWVESLSVDGKRAEALNLTRKVVERYRDDQTIEAWQVENEPFLSIFGERCDLVDGQFLKDEVGLVRRLDSRKIVVTASGELETWIVPMQVSDIFGTTLYRTVYNNFQGYLSYTIPPSFYNLKSKLVRILFASKNEKTIISELQAEPWAPGNNLKNIPLPDQIFIFSVENFKENIEYAEKTGFDEVYLWGAEWWYFMREKGHPEYWEFAKQLF